MCCFTGHPVVPQGTTDSRKETLILSPARRNQNLRGTETYWANRPLADLHRPDPYISDVPVLQLALYALVREKTSLSVYKGNTAPHRLGQIPPDSDCLCRTQAGISQWYVQ